eukprot:TRINITY_DN905_c0_g1_i1.p1 TRINITY_DN905_c0_g1~~TRINITY_DN905_c0_g1_i1.p1  ORF type:complete len:711 (+),score=237.87 TRINITY_DN905_c0_g1_i1:37-2169(+)
MSYADALVKGGTGSPAVPRPTLKPKEETPPHEEKVQKPKKKVQKAKAEKQAKNQKQTEPVPVKSEFIRVPRGTKILQPIVKYDLRIPERPKRAEETPAAVLAAQLQAKVKEAPKKEEEKKENETPASEDQETDKETEKKADTKPKIRTQAVSLLLQNEHMIRDVVRVWESQVIGEPVAQGGFRVSVKTDPVRNARGPRTQTFKIFDHPSTTIQESFFWLQLLCDLLSGKVEVEVPHADGLVIQRLGNKGIFLRFLTKDQAVREAQRLKDAPETDEPQLEDPEETDNKESEDPQKESEIPAKETANPSKGTESSPPNDAKAPPPFEGHVVRFEDITLLFLEEATEVLSFMTKVGQFLKQSKDEKLKNKDEKLKNKKIKKEDVKKLENRYTVIEKQFGKEKLNTIISNLRTQLYNTFENLEKRQNRDKQKNTYTSAQAQIENQNMNDLFYSVLPKEFLEKPINVPPEEPARSDFEVSPPSSGVVKSDSPAPIPKPKKKKEKPTLEEDGFLVPRKRSAEFVPKQIKAPEQQTSVFSVNPFDIEAQQKKIQLEKQSTPVTEKKAPKPKKADPTQKRKDTPKESKNQKNQQQQQQGKTKNKTPIKQAVAQPQVPQKQQPKQSKQAPKPTEQKKAPKVQEPAKEQNLKKKTQPSVNKKQEKPVKLDPAQVAQRLKQVTSKKQKPKKPFYENQDYIMIAVVVLVVVVLFFVLPSSQN